MKIINIDRGIGGWYGITANWLRSLLPEDKSEAVLVRLNTPGGDVFEGFKIYQLLKEYENVTVEIGALVASAGTYAILSAGKILVRETSSAMIHKAWSVAWGNSNDMDKESEILKGIDTMIAKTYAKRNNSTQKKMLKAMEDETWLFGGQAIIDFGLADEMITEEEPEEIDEQSVKATVNASLKSCKNELYKIKMGENPPENKMSNSIEKEESKLTKDKTNNEATAITQADVDNQVNAERDRINKILNVSGLEIDPKIAAAIQNGQSYEQFCVALAESRPAPAPEAKETRNTSVSNVAALGNVSAAPLPNETVPTNDDPVNALQNELDAMYEARKGRHV